MNKAVLLCAFVLAAQAQVKIGEAAGQLILADQYDHPFQLSDLRGFVAVLLVGDRAGSNFIDVWSRAISARYKPQDYPQLKRVSAANLASVPGLLHGFVKKKFFSKDPTHPASPVLLDWQGAIAHSFGFRDSVTNVYVIDRDGMMQYKGSGKGSGEELDSLFHVLDALPSR
jgi:predicted transcriptional regulator